MEQQDSESVQLSSLEIIRPWKAESTDTLTYLKFDCIQGQKAHATMQLTSAIPTPFHRNSRSVEVGSTIPRGVRGIHD